MHRYSWWTLQMDVYLYLTVHWCGSCESKQSLLIFPSIVCVRWVITDPSDWRWMQMSMQILMLSKKAKLKNQKLETSSWNIGVLTGSSVVQIRFVWFLKGTWVLSFGTPQALSNFWECNSMSQNQIFQTWSLESGTVLPSNVLIILWYMCIFLFFLTKWSLCDRY